MLDEKNGIARLNIMIGEKKVWGKGYGSEAWQAVQNYLLNHLKFRIVYAGCMECNAGMINIMKKSGMKPYFVRKNYFILEGVAHDSVHFYKSLNMETFQ